ncbi:MAG: thioredoxin domain-containing protein, partial [Micrococcales bacterium]|nr:thioredoxin domain-containing protein [Micrococcales bacterium]
MSYQRSKKQKVGARARRVQDRELARTERIRRARRAKQRRIGLRVGAVVGVIAVLAGIAFGINGILQTNWRGPANMASDGVLLSSGDGSTITASTSGALPNNGTPTPTGDVSTYGVTAVVAYVDYGDPASAAWWAANGSLMEQMLLESQGQMTLEIHPVAVPTARETFTPMPATPSPSPDAATPTAAPAATPTAAASPGATPSPTPTQNLLDAGYDYALRAANAFACVVDRDPDSAMGVNDALFAAQATFGTAGLTDAQLISLVAKAGVTDRAVNRCITTHHFEHWAMQATTRAMTAVPFDGVKALGTAPLIVVGGHQYTGKVDDTTAFWNLFMQAYEEASQASAAAQGNTDTTPQPDQTTAPTTAP